ncbi:hypothetical protein E4U30_007823 [Claviceps sp. LM220 group G6]|nr:hypothetical protein E4U15_002004 [Claviceps sp. LM218 group G6]KAG6098562.1 hypothetical protein E4U30_007823 [Claviceps sp. LM220 group G6]
MTEKEDFHKFVTKFMHTAQKAQLSTRDYVYDFKKRLPYRLQTHLAATPVDVLFQQFTHTAAQAHLSLKNAESTNPRGTANRGSGNTTAAAQSNLDARVVHHAEPTIFRGGSGRSFQLDLSDGLVDDVDSTTSLVTCVKKGSTSPKSGVSSSPTEVTFKARISRVSRQFERLTLGGSFGTSSSRMRFAAAMLPLVEARVPLPSTGARHSRGIRLV